MSPPSWQWRPTCQTGGPEEGVTQETAPEDTGPAEAPARPSRVAGAPGGSAGGGGQCQPPHHLPAWSRASSTPMMRLAGRERTERREEPGRGSGTDSRPHIQGLQLGHRSPQGLPQHRLPLGSPQAPPGSLWFPAGASGFPSHSLPPTLCCTNGSAWGPRDLPAPPGCSARPLAPSLLKPNPLQQPWLSRAAKQPCSPRRLGCALPALCLGATPGPAPSPEEPQPAPGRGWLHPPGHHIQPRQASASLPRSRA